MDHTVENKHFPGVFEATPLRAPVRPWGHAPRQANPVLTQGRRGAQGRDTPPYNMPCMRCDSDLLHPKTFHHLATINQGAAHDDYNCNADTCMFDL